MNRCPLDEGAKCDRRLDHGRIFNASYSTLQRKQRDISKGKIDGRSQEIQRLIGRAMRAAIDLQAVGPRTIWIDCDVLQADAELGPPPLQERMWRSHWLKKAHG